MMEKLTMHPGLCIKASTEFCLSQKDCYSCAHGRNVFKTLAAYEDLNLSPNEIAEKLKELAEYKQLEDEGRLIKLPCKPNADVYVILEDYFNCKECEHGSKAKYNKDINKIACNIEEAHCPLYIEPRTVKGFTVKVKDGKWTLSDPGKFGYEGLETHYGYDGVCYYSRAEAEAVMKGEK